MALIPVRQGAKRNLYDFTGVLWILLEAGRDQAFASVETNESRNSSPSFENAASNLTTSPARDTIQNGEENETPEETSCDDSLPYEPTTLTGSFRLSFPPGPLVSMTKCLK